MPKDMTYREVLILVYLVFLLLWFGGLSYLVIKVGISTIEALGLGTASGVFLSAFKDAWQFLFRKKGSGD